MPYEIATALQRDSEDERAAPIVPDERANAAGRIVV